MQKKLIGAFLLALVFIASTAFAQNVQLLLNPSVETWTNGPGSAPDNWINVNPDSISATREGTIVHSGSYSTNLTWISPTQASCEFLSDAVAVTAGETYACSTWALDNDIAGRITVSYRWNTGNYFPSNLYTTDNSSWQQIGFIQVAPAGATTLRVVIRCYDLTDGSWDGNATVYVDDIHLWGPPVSGNIPPSISNVLRYPYPVINPGDNAVVVATITDSDGSISTDSLYWRVLPAAFAPVREDSIATGSNYWFTIGSHSAGDSVEYYVVATDNQGARSFSPTRGYTVAGGTPPSHVPIYAIQHTTNEDVLPNCFPSDSLNMAQTITGIVVGRYERSGGSPPYRSRFLMQDAATPWSGINVYYATDTVQVGDSVTVAGTILEYFGETELQAVTSFTNHSSGHTLPGPAILDCSTFKADSCNVNAEPYEGMYIQLNNLTIGDSSGYGGLWAWDNTGDSTIIGNDLYRLGDNPPTITIGETYTYIKGIGRYIRGRYRINPRFASDVYTAPTECTGGSVFDVQFTFDPGSDTADCWPSPDSGTMVTICGIVTAVTQGSQPTFYMQDQGNTTWGGLYCFDYRLNNGDTVDVHVGDYVQVTSRVHEYYGWTELDSISEFTTLGTNQPLPDTFLVTVANFAGLCDIGPESYEDILVRINSVTVLSDNGFGELWIRDNSGPDSIRIDSDLWTFGTDQPNPLPSPGATYDWIIGVVKWQGRQGAGYDRGWVLLPRFASDYEQGIIPEPEIVDVWSINSTSMAVSFDRTMDPVTTQVPGNYSTTHGLSITGAVLDPGGRKVVLTTGTQPNNMVDSLVTVNLCDDLGTCMTGPHYGLFHSGFTSLSVVNTPTAGGDTSAIRGDVVTLKGWIVADTSMNHPTNFFLNDPGTPAPGGILAYTGGFVGTLPFIGDSVIVTGRVDEYFMATEFINLGTFNNFVILSSSGPDPVPYEATVAELNANQEEFEGVLVTVCDSFEITNLSPDTSALQYGFMIRSLTTPTDSIIVHKQDVHTRYAYIPVVGAHIRGITGVYKFQRGQFRISPRFDADINSFDTYCGGGGGCVYVPGDINSNGSANGIDVTYGVTYLKGGTAPPDTCFNCPTSGNNLLAAMDVNGSCSANGIDITFFVAYLKQLQPALLYCATCPPATLVAPGQEIPSITPILRKAKSSGNSGGIE